MSHSGQSWSSRFKTMGDEAEKIFEEIYPQAWDRYGWNRPSVPVHHFPLKIRYTPDYATSKGLVEVMGLGSKRVLKLKAEKLQAMWEWGHDFRVDLFVWDRTESRYGFCRLHDIEDLCYNGDIPTARFDNDNKLYFAIPVDQLPVAEWIPHDPKG